MKRFEAPRTILVFAIVGAVLWGGIGVLDLVTGIAAWKGVGFIGFAVVWLVVGWLAARQLRQRK